MPARRNRTPSAEVARELLGAAEAILVRHGPGGLTVRAVAAEAGIAPMGVYSRLGGKEGLVDALLIKGFDRLRAAIEADDEPDAPPACTTAACGTGTSRSATGTSTR
jgi:AcrR family transcriptional regulator